MDAPDVPVFLEAYHPLFICVKCLATIMQQDPASIAGALRDALVAGKVETSHQWCLNCGSTDTVVRVRQPRSPA